MKNIINKPTFNPVKQISKATMKTSSPYPYAHASFNWLNVDFPYLHTHNHWELLIVIAGQLKHILNGYTEICNRGYACLIRPSDAHRIEYVNNEHKLEFINFTFSMETAKKFFEFYNTYPVQLNGEAPLHFSLNDAFIDSIINQALIAQASNKETYEQHSVLLVHQLLTFFLSQQLNSNNAYPQWLNDFLYFLHDPRSFKMKAEELAAYTAYSYSHLSRIFKQYLDRTLIDYINEIKILYAKRLLRTTQKSIIEISLDLGFNSVSSLNHLFKEFTTLTPSQYRKKYKEERVSNT